MKTKHKEKDTWASSHQAEFHVQGNKAPSKNFPPEFQLGQYEY